MPYDITRYQPRQIDIDNLIRASDAHPLGQDFLINGHLGTVAITFQCHAFTVVAARDQLIARRAPARES